MNTIIDHTSVLCPRCRASHPATVERNGRGILGRVHCPCGERTVPLSSDADGFLLVRSRSRCSRPRPDDDRPRLINLLPLTQHCNLRCPVCYAESGPQSSPSFLAVEEAVHRMAEARNRGARVVSLTGGEATLHPELPTLIRRARSLGLRALLVTNGIRLGREPDLARELKRAGLFRVSLQLDTLNRDTHRLMRGDDFVDDKLRAARHVVAAGLRLGLIATVTRHNLPDIDDLIAFGLSLTPALSSITLQVATPAGRFDLDSGATVDKEQILAGVLRARSLPGVSLDDVWPLPHFEPWGMSVHPDCAVNLIALTGRDHLGWLRDHVDLARLHRRLGETASRRHWAARNLTPLRHILGSTRPGSRAVVLAHLLGFLRGRGRRGLLMIGVGEFCRRDFLDEARVGGCATDELTATGGVSPCLLYTGWAE